MDGQKHLKQTQSNNSVCAFLHSSHTEALAALKGFFKLLKFFSYFTDVLFKGIHSILMTGQFEF